MKFRFFVILVIALMLGLISCTSEIDHKISLRNPATLQNPIFSVEPRNNGTYTIWLLNDDVAAYCAIDKNVGETALNAVRSKDNVAVITYRNLNPNDPNYPTSSNPNACWAEGAKVIYLILTIEVLH